jgi:hypothetical protein
MTEQGCLTTPALKPARAIRGAHRKSPLRTTKARVTSGIAASALALGGFGVAAAMSAHGNAVHPGTHRAPHGQAAAPGHLMHPNKAPWMY